MLNYRELRSNVSVALVAQGVVMLLSVVQVLLVPKVLGVSQFGYWQLFLFYASFAGLFPLGLIDGIYLIHGGTSRIDIDKKSIFSQMVFGMVYELLFSAGIVAIAISGGFGPERELVITCTGVYILLKDITGYISTLFQTMNETKRSSYSTIVERVAYFCLLAALLMLHVTDFAPYVLAVIVSTLIQLAYCMWYYRDFVRVGFLGWWRSAQEVLGSVRVGMKLMVANIAGQLVIGVARLMLDQKWGIEVFGQLSLMLSLAGFFLAFVNQVGMVLFPALRQTSVEDVFHFYSAALDAMSFIGLALYTLYFPIIWLVSLWLPEYSSALVYLGYLMPICVFDGKMSVTCTTYFKVMREERLLLGINLCTVLLSAAGAAVGAFALGSVEATIASPVIAIVLRSVVSEAIVASRMKQESIHNITSELLITVVFLCCITFLSETAALVVFTVFCGSFVIAKRRMLATILDRLRSSETT